MDWKQRIERAQLRYLTIADEKAFTKQDVDLANDFDTCVVGECDEKFPGVIKRGKWGDIEDCELDLLSRS